MSATYTTKPASWRPLFAHTLKDVFCVLAGVGHFAFVFMLVRGFSDRPMWLNVVYGCLFSVAIAWNLNGVAHNFIHTPYFSRKWMNKLFSLVESWAIGSSQTFYHWMHTRHHIGNSDRKDDKGETIDWLSIYRHSHDDHPEHPLSYIFLGFFREDIAEIYRSIRRKHKWTAYFGLFELATWLMWVAVALWWDWRAVLFLVPFYYFGNCLSMLNGYYLHLNSNPDKPIAWGVSSYQRFYNWVWFGAGYHAEHHYRPRMHWTKLRQFHQDIADKQREAGTHSIGTWHMLGFTAESNRKIKREKKLGLTSQHSDQTAVMPIQPAE